MSTPSPQPAKVVSLVARPQHVAHLSFPVDGVIDTVTPLGLLGASIPAASVFNYDSFCGKIYSTTLSAGLPGGAPNPTNWAGEISSQLNGFTLMTLRSGGGTFGAAAAALENAMIAWNNAYLAKYSAISQIASDAQENLNVELASLQDLQTVANQQWNALQPAYAAAGLSGADPVVTMTNSWIYSSEGEGLTQTDASGKTVATTTGVAAAGNLPWAGPFGGNDVGQLVANQNYVFRTPYLEAQAQFDRANSSLSRQIFAQQQRAPMVNNLVTVLQNELNLINLNVYLLQLAYLNTFLTSPIPGIVTGVYKRPGEAVRAGETVVRVENMGNGSTVYLVGTVVYPGPINVGTSSATVTTSLYDAGGAQVSMSGPIIAARGHRDDNTWQIIVAYVNGAPVMLPLNYHFDYDNITMTIA